MGSGIHRYPHHLRSRLPVTKRGATHHSRGHHPMSRRSRLHPHSGSVSAPQPQWPPASPDAAATPTPKKSRRAAAALVACGVLLALLVIGGIIVATRSGTDKKVSAASSSTVTSGASAGSSTTTAGQAATDFKTFHDTTNNFSIGTPPSWQQVSLSDPKAQAAIDQLRRPEPATRSGHRERHDPRQQRHQVPRGGPNGGLHRQRHRSVGTGRACRPHRQRSRVRRV